MSTPSATRDPDQVDAATLDRLLHFWADSLGLGGDAISPDTDFFASGADSMDAIYMETRIEEHFKVILPDHAVIEAPTPAEMEELIRERRAAPDGLLERPRRGLVAIFSSGAPGVPPMFILGDYPKAGWLSRHLSGPRGIAHVINPLVGVKHNSPRYRALPVEAIRVANDIAAVQPEGPWRLMAVCGNAPMMWETAHLLSQRGEVSLLLFDPILSLDDADAEPGSVTNAADPDPAPNEPPLVLTRADFDFTLLLTPSWDYRPLSERWVGFANRPPEIRFLPSSIPGHAITARSISLVAAEIESWLAARDAGLPFGTGGRSSAAPTPGGESP